LEKVLKNLDPKFRKEIMDCWLEYESLKSREGKFVRQIDKIETLLQAKEYWEDSENSPVFGWWEEVNELVDDPVLLDFLEAVKKNKKAKKRHKNILKFLLDVNKLKQMPRTGLLFRGVKDPETIGEQTFVTAIMTWVFGVQRNINMEKVLKMALSHEICEVYAGDATPYDSILPRPKEEIKKMLSDPTSFSKKEIIKTKKLLKKMYKVWPKFSRDEKEELFKKDYDEEKKALKKLTSILPKNLRKEMFCLWDDFKLEKTREGNLVNQAYWIQSYFQTLQYLYKDKNFPIRPWREQMIHFLDDCNLLELFKLMEERFY